MKQFLKTMKALSDPNRVKIIKMLEQREMCVCEIRAALGLAQPTISKHLKVLEDAGLVESTKEGMWVNYKLASATANDDSIYARTMLTQLKQWLNDDPEIKKLLGSLKYISRETICKE
ncbi:winged helix-turn-helix transcriptional regulator [Desulfohalobiaceae bacterium Ax17]|uniref:ArsR/SmtB family transcription factor n=1 Tax=Desulfovulcanus ferrireducens TaxID=2831190 RepID=UPI00207BAB3E|nr:metalloregulator ArsR/SmtB family transcription factor [Desulfovulcanus ferrireducens]MBT8763191.1 winged helix-turn-helix transcriptional regulator [Desulfovulcanus ferrireducens]